MAHLSFTNPREVTGVGLLLSAKEAQHYLSSKKLPSNLPERLDAYVRLATCTNCDDLLDMNIVLRHHDQNPSWCTACCDESGLSAFARYVGHDPAPGDVRVYWTPELSWKREDPLTLSEAYDYLVDETLPADFQERVRVVYELGLEVADQDALGIVSTLH